MSIVWPSYVSPTPTPAARLGRLLHYASFLPAAVFVWAGATAPAPFDPSVTPGYFDDLVPAHHFPAHDSTALTLYAIAVLIVLTGRGLRWVFAGE